MGDDLAKWPRMVKKKFSDLTEAEKKNAVYIPPQLHKTPTKAQLTDWKNPKKFGIWLDDKHIKNKALDAYKATDIASFLGSYVHARQPEGYLYRMNLMTPAQYEQYLKKKEEEPFLFVAKEQPRSRKALETYIFKQ